MMARHALAGLVLSALVTAALPAIADDVPALARLVPADAGLCLEASDLAQHVPRMTGGVMSDRLRQWPPTARWLADHGSDATQYGRETASLLGLTVDELWSRLLARQLLLAVWPAESKALHHGEGLLLIEADDEQVLEQALQRLADAHRAQGRLLRPLGIERRGRSYTVQMFATGDEQRLYATAIGTLGVVTNSKAVLHRVLDLQSGEADSRTSLADTDLYRDSRAVLPRHAPIRVVINPRAWDAALGFDGQTDQPLSPKKQLARDAWLALQYAAMSVQLDDRLQVETAVSYEPKLLPPLLQVAAASLSGPADLAANVPGNAMASMSGRGDLSRLLGALLAGQKSPPSVQQIAVIALLEGLGPNYVGYVVPRSAHAPLAGIVPVDWVIGLETRPLAGRKEPLAETIDALLQAGMTVAARSLNAQQGGEAARVVVDEDSAVTSFDYLGLVQPSYGVQGSTLWLGSSADAVAARLAEAGEQPDAVETEFDQRAGGQAVSNEPDDWTANQSLRIDLRRVRRLLEGRPELPAYLSQLKKLDQATAMESWQQLLGLLNVADNAELRSHVDERAWQTRLELTIDPASSSQAESPDQLP